ncbi:MAG: M6 family metalloprotease domain-containing protein [Gemmatimonadales bacterium]
MPLPRAIWRPAVLATLVVLGASAFPCGLVAQRPARAWEPRGFDFRPEGVWRVRARRVRAVRDGLIARGDFFSLNNPIENARGLRAQLNAPGAAGSAAVVSGVLKVPVFLVRFKNTDTTTLRAPALYDSILLGATPPAGRPYTVRTFYEEMSHGLLSVQGVVIGWITLDSADSYYAGPGTCDGLCFSAHIAQLIREAVAKAPGNIDWGQFDNDGPDGIPNSGDDDGVVDLIWLIQPKPGAECGYSGNIWAHRFYYSAWAGATLATPSVANSTSHPGSIQVDNYTIQSAVGGVVNGPSGTPVAGCDPTQPMPPGTIAHETGHGLGLPDFYDTNPGDQDNSEGIGEWGLMGSGNWARQGSPSHMEAFSLAQLGWVTVAPIATSSTYHLGPVETSDSVLLLRPTVANPRGEYFLLENRQALLADSAMIGKHGGGGLLVWHVDSTQYARCTLPNNCVNTGPIHGLALVQADGLDNLGSSTAGVSNRGDGGDPYPGTTHNPALTPRTTPAAAMNATGSAAGIALDSIAQVAPLGDMRLRVRFGGITTIVASDPAAFIKVRDSAYNRFQDLFLDGDTITIAADSSQLSADGRRKDRFVSWSDNGPRSHVVTLSATGGVITANLSRQYMITYAVVGGGSIMASPGASASGSFAADGDSVTLAATASSGKVFANWSGDTTTVSSTLQLRMTRPWTVTATFIDPLTVDAVVTQFLARAGTLSSDQIAYLDLIGNHNGRLDLGDIMAWLDKSGTPVSAAQRQRLAAGSR